MVELQKSEAGDLATLGASPSLVKLAEGVQQTLVDRRAPNTWKALSRRFARFQAWAESEGLEWMPASPLSIVLYGEHLDREGKAFSTIRAYISSVGSAHIDNGLRSPSSDPRVKEFLAGKRRQHAGRRQRQAAALSEAELQAVYVSLGRRRVGRGGKVEREDFAARRAALDYALLVTMVQAALRRSEASELEWGDVQKQPDGTGRVEIRKSKGDQRGYGATVAVKEDCIRALEALRLDECANNGRVFALSPSQISRRLKAMCAEAGIDAERVSGHTPRVTLARGMSEKGAPTHVIQQQCRWESPGMVLVYTRGARAAEALQWM